MPEALIIDTDPGIDDAMAILLAFRSPELEVVGLTTVFGNGDVETVTVNTLRLAALVEPPIPVVRGAARALVREQRPPVGYVHGDDAWGNTNPGPAPGQPIDGTAAEFIVETVMARPGEITLLALGPLTNLALALRAEPRLAQAVRRVVVMGGAATVPGNVTPAAEANIWHDPHAAAEVFSAGWPLTMVGLDVTKKVLTTLSFLAELEATGTPFGRLLARISPLYCQYYGEREGVLGAYMHDAVATAVLVAPEHFTMRPAAVEVVTGGPAMGQTVARFDDVPLGAPVVDVCLGVNAEALTALYWARLSQ